MGWETDIEELRRREALARQMGGPDKVKRQHDAGRLTVRERIDALLDPGSFHEIGALAGRANMARTANGRSSRRTSCSVPHRRPPVVVGGDDQAGGAAMRELAEAGDVGADGKRAAHPGVPVDGTGGGGSVKTIETQGYNYVPANPAWDWVVANMGTVR